MLHFLANRQDATLVDLLAASSAFIVVLWLIDQTFYWLGWRFGEQVFATRLGRCLLRKDHLHRVERLMRRRIGWAMAIAHWIPGSCYLVSVFAGTRRLPYPRFALASLFACTMWATPVVLGGYATVVSWLAVAAHSRVLAGVGAAVVAVVGTAWWARGRRRRRAHIPMIAPPVRPYAESCGVRDIA